MLYEKNYKSQNKKTMTMMKKRETKKSIHLKM